MTGKCKWQGKLDHVAARLLLLEVGNGQVSVSLDRKGEMHIAGLVERVHAVGSFMLLLILLVRFLNAAGNWLCWLAQLSLAMFFDRKKIGMPKPR